MLTKLFRTADVHNKSPVTAFGPLMSLNYSSRRPKNHELMRRMIKICVLGIFVLAIKAFVQRVHALLVLGTVQVYSATSPGLTITAAPANTL